VTLDEGVRTRDGGADVAISFPRAEVIPQLVDATPAVELLIYIFDEKGATAGFKSKRITFDAAARVNSGYVTIREPFDLPPGRYAAKALLRVAGTSAVGFVRRDFTVE